MIRTSIALLAVLAAPPALAAEGRDVALDRVPPAAMAAALAAAGGERPTAARLDLGDGRATYELSTTDGEGRGVEIDVLADGTVLEVEYATPLDDVPDRVLTFLRSYLPDMQPTTVERSVRRNFVTFYEFEGERERRPVSVEARKDAMMIVIREGRED